MQIVFVRHGEAMNNHAMVITASIPGAELTPRGVEQVRQTGALLAGSGALAVYSSPLRRARQSAEILSEALGVPVIEEQGLRECAVGDLEGATDEASFTRFNETFDRWYRDGDLDFALGPSGETAREALHRAREAVGRIALRHPSRSVVVAVTHQTLLQLMLTFLSNNLPSDFGHRRWMANGGISRIEVSPERIECVEWDGREVVELLGGATA